MNLHIRYLWALLALSVGCVGSSLAQAVGQRLALAPPQLKGAMSVEQALQQRRSMRSFGQAPLGLDDVAQLVWAAQGVTHPQGYRTTPSAGALQPLVIYLVAARVAGLAPGVYRYQPQEHALVLTLGGDLRSSLAQATLGQSSVREASAVLVLAAVYQRTAQKYGNRAERYVHIEVGHAAQNVYLQATARGLGTVLVGALDDLKARDALGLPADHLPVGLMPVGRLLPAPLAAPVPYR